MTLCVASLEELVRLLIGAGGPTEWPANVPWPLHQAVASEVTALSIGTDSDDVQPVTVVPWPGLGLKVEGLDAAVHRLALAGELSAVDHGFFSCWSVASRCLPALRQMVMRLDVGDALTAQRAGRRWAALCETSLKNLRIAAASSTSTSRSAIPTALRQVVAPERL